MAKPTYQHSSKSNENAAYAGIGIIEEMYASSVKPVRPNIMTTLVFVSDLAQSVQEVMYLERTALPFGTPRETPQNCKVNVIDSEQLEISHWELNIFDQNVLGFTLFFVYWIWVTILLQRGFYICSLDLKNSFTSTFYILWIFIQLEIDLKTSWKW